MKFLIGKEKDFYDFFDSITEKDRIAFVTHNDLDGLASAVFLQEILKSKKLKPKKILFVSYDKSMFVSLAEQLKKKKINKVFLTDVSESSDYDDFELFRSKFDVFFIDHHATEIKNKKNIIKDKLENCVAFLMYNLGSKITDLSKWKPLLCATMIAEMSFKDAKNFEFMKSIYPELQIDTIFDSVPAKLSNKISSGLIILDNPKKVFKMILKGKTDKLERYSEMIKKETDLLIEKYKKEAEFYPEKNLYFFYYTPKVVSTFAVITILSSAQKDKTLIFVSDIPDEPEYVKVSSRNQSMEVDMNLLLKKCIEGFENATAGGHVPAAGGKFMKKDLQRFKENLLNAL
jgi:single-stranded DNA-specific DHH superfamily exonuclease